MPYKVFTSGDKIDKGLIELELITNVKISDGKQEFWYIPHEDRIYSVIQYILSKNEEWPAIKNNNDILDNKEIFYANLDKEQI